MSGTLEGGRKAAATNKAKYGKEFYADIGRKGGRNGHTGGFAANPELARIAGAKGGKKSKRGPAKRGGRVISANYNEAQLARIREELGWNDDQAREDYKPTEPLIKDEKIRKAIRAWWETIPDAVTDKRVLYKNNHDFEVGIYSIYCGAIYPETLEKCRLYTITELCGEEEG